MRRVHFLIVILAVVATPTIAQKITIDYAHDFDFSQVKSFSYVETQDTDLQNTLADSRLESAILRELKSGGLKQVDSGGDILVTYHVVTQDNTVFNTTNYGYGGWGPGWGGYGRYGYGYGGYGYGGGMGSSTTTTTTYTEGTLIVDAYDPTEKKMIWRGTGTVTVKSKPEKQAKQVDNILSKMGKKWDKILAGQGK